MISFMPKRVQWDFVESAKVHLCSKPQERVKYDKIVVYFSEPSADAPNKARDMIAEFFRQALGEEELVDEFAPFYEVIGKGIAWGEERADKGSFSEARIRCIAEVVHENQCFNGFDEFIAAVKKKFSRSGINPNQPHLYLADSTS